MKHADFFQAVARLIEFQRAFPPLTGSDDTGPAPLGLAQNRIWQMQRLREDPSAYNLNYRLRFQGPLDPDRLETALRAVIRRHEILRSVYTAAANGTAVQTALAADFFTLERAAELNETALAALLERQARRPFDLTREIPLRACLVRQADTEHLLILTIHHIAFDFDSLEIFLDDLARAYDRPDEARAAPGPAIQYADYARWETAAVATAPVRATLENFWKTELSGGVAGPEFFARNYFLSRKEQSASLAFELSACLSAALRTLARDEGVNLFTACLTAYYILFYEPEHPDFFLCCPASGRARAELERTIGYFVNPVVLRGDLRGRPSFRDLLGRVRGTVTGAFAHQDLPVEQVDAAGLLLTPLAGLMFAFLRTPRLSAPCGLSLTVENLGETYGAAVDFAMYLYLMETGETISGRFVFDPALLAPEAAVGLVEGYRAILALATRDPERSIDFFPRPLSGAFADAARPERESPGSGPETVPAGRIPPLTAYTRAVVAETLGLPVARVPLDRSLLGLRFDSLAAIRLRGRVLQDTGIDLRLAKILRGPTILQVAEFLEHAGARPPDLNAAAPEDTGTEREDATGDGSGMTAGQQALWLIHHQAPLSDAYNVSYAARVRGNLEEVRLRAAVRTLSLRHECLRTVFPEKAHGPHAAPRSEPLFEFETLDARAWSFHGMYRALRAFHKKPYDLSAGPLLRVLVARRGAFTFLVIGLHHIVIDYISLNLLVNELFAIYDGRVLPPAPSSGDALRAERTREKNAAADLRAWRRQLASPPPPLRLPFTRKTPGENSARSGGTRRFRFPAAAVRAASVLLAALFALVYRITGQEDILIGTPATARSWPGSERVIGYLVNPIVLRARVTADDTFRDLVTRSGAVLAHALDHSALPFARLVEHLAPERHAAKTPYFQILFNYLVQADPIGTDGLSLERFEIPQTEGQFDFTLELTDHEDEIAGALKYDAGLFNAAGARQIAELFTVLLTGLLAADNRPIGEQPLSQGAARERLVRRMIASGTREPSPQRTGVTTLHGFFEEQAGRTPHNLALIAGGERLSYAELNARAAGIAAALRARGIGPEMRVGVYLRREAELIASLLGILKAGAAYVPLDPAYPAERVRFMAEDSGARLVLARQGAEPPNSSVPALYIEEIAREPVGTAGAGAVPGPRNLAYVIYTSGSTGRPKGVAIEHRSAVALIEWTLSAYSAEDLAHTLAATSFCFDLSVFEIFAPLACGGTVLLAENALAWAGLSEASAVTLVNTVPSAMNELIRLGLPGSPRVINLAGEPLRQTLVTEIHRALPGVRLYDLYGPSEDTTYSTRALREPGGEASIGHPLPGTRAYILDAGGHPLPDGIPGELYLAGRGLARGYLNRPELTALRFLPDPFARGNERMYRTGDLVTRGPAGDLRFIGRVDHQVKTRGYRVEPGEIEAALSAHPAVNETVVIPDNAAGTLLAYWTPREKTFARASAPGAREPTEQWRAVWDRTYTASGADPRFDTTGWVQRDGRVIPPHEMREWLDETVQTIREYSERTGFERVLDIGCGTGLLLFALLPDCAEYTATDFSGEIIARLKAELGPAEAAKTRLAERAADDFTDFPADHFDLVILNSVAQYFPDETYLRGVITGALRVLKPDGLVFIGDVRNLPVERRHAASDDRELLLDPAYFTRMARTPGPAVLTLVKNGSAHNDLTRFRYSALVRKTAPARPPVLKREDCAGERPDLDRLRAKLAAGTGSFCLERVPDARLNSDGVDPAMIGTLAREHGFRAVLSCARSRVADEFDAVFLPATASGWPEPPEPESERGGSSLFTNPYLSAKMSEMEGEFRDFLKQSLPEFMIPARFMGLYEFPRTPGGKLDRAALPAPDRHRPTLRGDSAAPGRGLETTVAEIWRELLKVDRVGANDNFFDLGGHSLLLIKIGARLQNVLGRKISPTDLFKYPTINTLVAFLTRNDEPPAGARSPGHASRMPGQAPGDTARTTPAAPESNEARDRRRAARRPR